MRYAPVALAIVVLCLSTAALAGPNVGTTLPLHALETAFGPCDIADPCPDPTVNVAANTTQWVYLLIKNYTEVAGVQTAFDFGGWTFMFGLWDCQSNQVNGVVPGNPGGPTAGSLATAFDCIQGGATEVVGRFQAMATGTCITQVDSAYPFGTHIVACAGGEDEIIPGDRGSVCVTEGGYNACEPSGSPVEPATWGSIKAQYN